MKIRVVVQQGQIVKPGQQLWMGYAGCSSCYENTSPWDLHLAVPLIVAFYWRGVCVSLEGAVDVENCSFHLGVLKIISNLSLGRVVALHK